MIKIKINLYIFFIFIVYANLSYSNEISLPNFGFICNNEKNSDKFEFIFSRNYNDTKDIVFRRIDGKFKYIGEVLAQKKGSYVLWEDKIFFRTSDFAWNLDKVTSTLYPIILSVGNKLESFSKIKRKK